MRILLIEDEVKLAHAIKRALETQRYTVDISHSGKEGLDLALGETYDMILLDLMLPEISGLEICEAVRKEGLHTPIIMLTAKGQVGDKVAGLDTGADDYLVKPFSFEELFARIRALGRRPHTTTDSLLQVNDLSLDPQSFKVYREGKPISLSTKEFSLLEYLMRHKNTIVTKEHIIRSIWNYDSDVLPNTVEVHMKHLREKVDAPFSRKLLHTVRGFGYELREK